MSEFQFFVGVVTVPVFEFCQKFKFGSTVKRIKVLSKIEFLSFVTNIVFFLVLFKLDFF